MVNVNDIKNGMTIEYEGNIYVVMDTQHVKPGKGAAIVKAKLKNLFLSGLFIGLSIATKWTGLYAGLALAIVFFVDLIYKEI